MTFKDLIRLLRRRWMTALLVFAAVFCGYMSVTLVTERPQYRARARILISTPPILLTAAQGTQWISVSQMDPKTWISIITSQRVRERAAAAFRSRKDIDVQPEWIANVSAVLDPEGQLAWIEAIRVVYAAGLRLAGITALPRMERLAGVAVARDVEDDDAGQEGTA